MSTVFLLIFYFIGLGFIFLFSLSQLHLTWHYKKALKKVKNQEPDPFDPDNCPQVTIQLPIYNEQYVVQRLIRSVAEIRYPKEKLEIQILDDSTDETTEIIEQELKNLNDDRFVHIRRTTREGFKAGALAHGMALARGEFFAIFDADFLPEAGFLEKTLPKFRDPGVGVVQTRWGHVNKDYSLLTRLLAFGLDAHFTIEQGGRRHAGSYINFNGTAGVWRKSCIEDAGGWSADTLTEDLDLSYRAQMKGWQFEYLESVISPAELPVVMAAIKSQQYRWNKGAAETARKHLGKILTSNMKWEQKVHAVFHLLNSTVFLFLLLAALLSVPLLWIKSSQPELQWVFHVGAIFLLGFLSILLFYLAAWKRLNPQGKIKEFLWLFPTFLTVSMGLSLHNAVAVAEGFLNIKSPFIRTPKFNIIGKEEQNSNIYLHPQWTWGMVVEGLLALYFAGGIALGILVGDWGLIVFHFMLSLGFSVVFYHSVKPLAR